ncbi:MAG TPA: hypothetical protein VG848_06490 [Acetobacteraceae bacterium]|nr:hypothetical protein [Acetobacteraceae bacterium]
MPVFQNLKPPPLTRRIVLPAATIAALGSRPAFAETISRLTALGAAAGGRIGKELTSGARAALRPPLPATSTPTYPLIHRLPDSGGSAILALR